MERLVELGFEVFEWRVWPRHGVDFLLFGSYQTIDVFQTGFFVNDLNQTQAPGAREAERRLTVDDRGWNEKRNYSWEIVQSKRAEISLKSCFSVSKILRLFSINLRLSSIICFDSALVARDSSLSCRHRISSCEIASKSGFVSDIGKSSTQ